MVRITTQPAAQAIGWALLQFVWQGALIGALTAVTLVALRRSAADVRYVVSTIALCLMLTYRSSRPCRASMPPGRQRLRASIGHNRQRGCQLCPMPPLRAPQCARVRPEWQQRTRPLLPPHSRAWDFRRRRALAPRRRGLSACCSSPCDWPLDGCGCTDLTHACRDARARLDRPGGRAPRASLARVAHRSSPRIVDRRSADGRRLAETGHPDSHERARRARVRRSSKPSSHTSSRTSVATTIW